MLDTSYGFNNLLKEGHKHFSGFEEVVLKNISNVKDISNMVKKSLGPNGMKKMVVNHIDKTFVTSDAATILKELEVQHPAAKMVVMASKMQENECGDATNLVVTFAGELLSHAQNLIRMGLHPSQIIVGYEQALKSALKLLNELEVWRVDDPRNQETVTRALKSTLTSKIPNYGDFFANLVAKACINSLPDVVNKFDNDNIRIVHIYGGNVNDSFLMSGMVIKRGAEGTITRVAKPVIAVYHCPLDTVQGETKGTILIKNANELLNYNKGEEDLAEKFVQGLVDAKVNVAVTGGTISDIVLHFLEKYRIMAVKVPSKFELKRVARALGAAVLSKLDPPTAEQVGEANEVSVEELGSQKMVVFKRETEECKLSSIILRGSTRNLLEDIERALDDSISLYKCLIREGGFCPGAGSAETILSIKLEDEAKKITGLDQYSYSRFAKSFEVIPRILAENAGLNSNQIISKLIVANKTSPHGIQIVTGAIETVDKLEVYDHLKTKEIAIKLASEAAITILKIDQIIIAKPAGGPKLQQNKNWDNDD